MSPPEGPSRRDRQDGALTTLSDDLLRRPRLATHPSSFLAAPLEQTPEARTFAYIARMRSCARSTRHAEEFEHGARAARAGARMAGRRPPPCAGSLRRKSASRARAASCRARRSQRLRAHGGSRTGGRVPVGPQGSKDASPRWAKRASRGRQASGAGRGAPMGRPVPEMTQKTMLSPSMLAEATGHGLRQRRRRVCCVSDAGHGVARGAGGGVLGAPPPLAACRRRSPLGGATAGPAGVGAPDSPSPFSCGVNGDGICGWSATA